MRKAAYIRMAKLSGITRDVLWQASSMHESRDIRQAFGARSQVLVAPDLAIARIGARNDADRKSAGRLRVLFLGRISRMKNLDGALRLLNGLDGQIEFNIYGPIEDRAYWRECSQLMTKLPSNIMARYAGEISGDRIGQVISEHDLMFLPSLGENYGHAIIESLASGCPVLTSDRTPWRDLEAAGAGWSLALERPDRYHEVLRRCVEMDFAAWSRLSEAAIKYGSESLHDEGARDQNRMLFRSCMERSKPAAPLTHQLG
jgi:glycosyltransferase involved in cell wall biosynthesis